MSCDTFEELGGWDTIGGVGTRADAHIGATLGNYHLGCPRKGPQIDNLPEIVLVNETNAAGCDKAIL